MPRMINSRVLGSKGVNNNKTQRTSIAPGESVREHQIKGWSNRYIEGEWERGLLEIDYEAH